jgi:hypothetical protein
MPGFNKLKVQIFMKVTHPILPDAEATDSTFPKLSVITAHHNTP